ncbi:hypothetical protein FKM82_024910 [Ascaphus truei]
MASDRDPMGCLSGNANGGGGDERQGCPSSPLQPSGTHQGPACYRAERTVAGEKRDRIPTGCITEEPGDSLADDPIVISSEEEVGVPSVAMRLPANHPSGNKEEQTSPDTFRQRRWCGLRPVEVPWPC